jgi:hypothetical protein
MAADGDAPNPTAVGAAEATAYAHPHASSGGGGRVVCAAVAEYIIYGSQTEHGAAENVQVPPPLTRCEAMWTLPPPARCACFLHALARAAHQDATVYALDAAALASLGPLALVALSTRFVRRHGLAPRVPALVMLCVGLVMGWLSATRQRMPSDCRKRPRTSAARHTLRAAHYASLYTRVATDLNVLNSACGEPLALKGPWEWFDGVLFEAMLVSAAAAPKPAQEATGAASCWAALLRGDAALVRVFELLRPLVLADEGVAQGENVARAAAAAWRKATAPRA